MGHEQLIALIVFALAGSFTPGPNNTIATATGANHGLRAAVPHIFGVPFGLSSMLAVGAVGAAALIAAHPALAAGIRWAGIAYLLAIAWSIARTSAIGERAVARPLTFWQSAAFQYANPKAWMLAAATAGTYTAADEGLSQIVVICAVFSSACAASLVVWAAAGAALKEWLKRGARLRTFNALMGALLAATAVWMAFE
ncbi:MAG: LysE family translocator [Gemmatimonadota bacterium]